MNPRQEEKEKSQGGFVWHTSLILLERALEEAVAYRSFGRAVAYRRILVMCNADHGLDIRGRSKGESMSGVNFLS